MEETTRPAEALELQEEEVDWGVDIESEDGSDKEEEDEDALLHVPAGLPDAKRRRVKEGWNYLCSRDKVALILEADPSSQVAQDQEATVFLANSGSAKYKPRLLRRYDRLPASRLSLFVSLARRVGYTYYSCKPLKTSASAAWLLQAAESRSQAYARMPLLLSPLTQQVSLPPGSVQIEVEPARKNMAGVAGRMGSPRFHWRKLSVWAWYQ